MLTAVTSSFASLLREAFSFDLPFSSNSIKQYQFSDCLRDSIMEPSYEIKTLPPAHISPDLGPSELEARSSYDRDQDELARLGKKQVLKVRGACSLGWSDSYAY